MASRQLPAGRLTTVWVPQGWRPPGLVLEADGSPLTMNRTSDTHRKRNAAIAVARQVGWRRVLFLDDDVLGFGRSELHVAMDVLADRPDAMAAVGWAFDDFADNSIVCHALRVAGGEQSTFIGGGAVAVRVDATIPHFPSMYNEDWLFLLPYLLDRRDRLALAGTLRQAAYDPFADPAAAQLQEAGDVLGEGLFRLLHERRSLDEAMTPPYWTGVLDDRRALITAISRTVSALARPGDGPVLESLRNAYAMHRRSPRLADELAAWVGAWQQDRVRWAQWLHSLPSGTTVDQALDHIGLRAHPPETTTLKWVKDVRHLLGRPMSGRDRRAAAADPDDGRSRAAGRLVGRPEPGHR